ncbi:DUF2938 family protein [Mitsuaria sp. WAJ17]|uniref:DUF2938 family protein n=1 Tax=Mitsuaria sp. WAJ17 TaxID=2761452 RepID=UPI0016043188|nr:DUF2938 family protein [Mitsuaria sp. WAJ17]MBB2483619.1 DUF2938 family protein [Mitsuaria sp. WAJ17]
MDGSIDWTPTLAQVLGLGVGATALMDLWLMGLRRAGVATLDFALLGRWAGHLPRGRWRHEAIARALPVRGERALGWFVHYAVGLLFATLLLAWQGPAWLEAPRLAPALLLGLATVTAPLLVMQPAMGAGLAGRRKGPVAPNVLRSAANHLVFGLGLYLSALALQLLRVAA